MTASKTVTNRKKDNDRRPAREGCVCVETSLKGTAPGTTTTFSRANSPGLEHYLIHLAHSDKVGFGGGWIIMGRNETNVHTTS